MRVLCVHPGPLMYSRIFLRLEPLGLELVAASVRQAGHEVALIDLQVETHRDFFGWVTRWRPDVILFSCNYLANVPEIVDLAKGAKAKLPRSVFCVGGHSASFVAAALIDHGQGAIDCVIRGEGEAAVPPLLTAIAAGGIDGFGGLGFGRADAAPLLLERLVGVGQFVGDDEGSEQQQASVADLPDALGEFADTGIDILGETADARLLPVVAGDLVRAAVDRHPDLAHLST
ncbi:MAG: cobalamin B12-binding domain-containing protein, partial [Stellaceae bacterium]